MSEPASATEWGVLAESTREAVAALVRRLLSEEAVEGLRRELTEACLERLLRRSAGMRGSFERADSGRHERLRALLDRIARQLLEGAAPPFARAYSRHLVAQLVPLQAHSAVWKALFHPPDVEAPAGTSGERQSQPDYRLPVDITDHLLRAHDHDLLGSHCRRAALEDLVDELFEASGDELAAKAAAILSDGEMGRGEAGGDAPGEWLARPQRLLLSVDHTSLSCARYLAGLEEPRRDRYGFDELRPAPTGRTKRIDQVTVKFEPVGVPHAPEGAGSRPSELKAKTFVALLTLAADHLRQPQSTQPRVTLQLLLELLGYRLGRSTNSHYYWEYAAQVTRHVLIDLPNRIVAMQATLLGAKEPLLVFERLVSRVAALDRDAAALPQPALSSLLPALLGSGAVSAVREAGVHGFEFEFSEEFLEALGLIDSRAVEHVPVELLALTGPAFWLAWQVSFLRRWATIPRSGGKGKPLLRVLADAGYLPVHRRGERVRYKDALRAWWRDTGELVDLGLLDEPGVRMYGQVGGRWRDVSGELSRRLEPDGARFSRDALEGIRVVFQLPASRLAQLQESRRRRRIGNGRAKA